MSEEGSPRQSSKRRTIVAGSLIAAALATGGVTIASAQSNPSPTAPATTSVGPNTGDQNDPNYTSSITVPRSAADAPGNNEPTPDPALATLAKLSPDQAKAVASAAVPGNAGTPELSDENGNLIYDVTVTSRDGKTTTDVKVDAGNGHILAREAGQDSVDRQETGNESGADNETGNESGAANDTSR